MSPEGLIAIEFAVAVAVAVAVVVVAVVERPEGQIRR
jgi:hypothetical protein